MIEPGSDKIRLGLDDCFIRLSEMPLISAEVTKLPESLKQYLSSFNIYALPAGGGHAVGYYFESSYKKQRLDKARLVLLGHGLGQSPCESNWIWIEAFLKAGFDVLVWSIDGHAKSDLAQFDARIASRSLTLIVDRLTRKRPDLGLYVVGHGLSATYSLLLGMRPLFHQALQCIVAVSPMLESDLNYETAGQLQLIRHPIHTLKSGLRLTKFYGLGGFRKLWKGENFRDLKKNLHTSLSLEAQQKAFLEGLPGVKHVVEQTKVRTLFIVSRFVSDQLLTDLKESTNPDILLEVETVHGPRGIQYLIDWPEKVTAFMEGVPAKGCANGENVCEAVH